MEGLCLFLAALSTAAPGRGTASREAAVARGHNGTPRFVFPTAPSELMASPSAAADNRTGNASVTRAPGGLRLAGGQSRCEGRVEMEEAGAWGTVCDDAWDMVDADVVCRQLQCGWAIRIYGNATFGRGSGPILRDDVGCTGHEETLWDCPAATEHNCSHKEDAGVMCSEHQVWRLSGGRDGCAGRVEVFFRGTWSTVCDSTWYELEASVLCRTLGCGEPLRQPSFSHTLPGRMVYQCDSHQPSLAHCLWIYNKSAPCHQSRAAGVVCNGSQGLQTPTMPNLVTLSNITLWSAEGSLAMGAQPLLHSPLFILCLVLAALLLLTVLAFTAALLRVRKMSAHPVSHLGSAIPVLVTHSAQSHSAPSGTSNDYRDMPPSLPKGPDPPVAAHPPAKASDSSSSSEHYEFSSKPPVALSTFYNSLRRQPTEQRLPLMSSQDGTEPFPAEVPARLGTPSRGTASSFTSSSSSSTEPYCNDSTDAPPTWSCPPPPIHGTHQHAAPTTHGYDDYPETAPPAVPGVPVPVPSQPWVPMSRADPDPADSSSTSSGEWYENVQRSEPSGDPSPHPGWAAPSCPAGEDTGDPHSSEGSDYDDIGGSAY